MAMISPKCLENLIEMGRWMGQADANMEQHMIVPNRQFDVIAEFNLQEVERMRLKLLETCPQREGRETDEDDPRYRFQVGLAQIQEHWTSDNKIVAVYKLRALQEALLEWVNDIAFAVPSRVAVRT